MSPQEIFKYKFKQSYSILCDMDQMRLLDLAAYLRHMLVDKLVDQVNREYRLQIRYEIGPVDGEFLWRFDVKVNGNSIVSYADHPTFTETSRKEVVNRDDFLAYKIVMTDGHIYSVRDVIDICANKAGGVHLEANIKDSDRLAALSALERQTHIGSVRGAWRSLGVIGRITLEALAPLYSRVCW